MDGRDSGEAAAQMHQILVDVDGVSDYRQVHGMYGPTVRESTGISEKHLKRMSTRPSCPLCAHAILATNRGSWE
ncbi:MAG: hypothetical protein F4W68_06210 [Cenarchaeum sp. SB0661_bin_35]|nr:hypothetical protein [Cenarchaeum sp. SB0667_bin_13]MXZ92952.1 hypothetical protein [Cenarchaeum sp. SB0666_bin_15]MYB47313.1 hypothetical protein [Cenarchaeum sp. SB0662_bin_33]MYC80070.1 hypothetical protein [Cenarchaeum sp. SB0661_bin_35]MYG33519.1 hypothetical protein [Cenarchaeum sp. SB0677_bin_16]